MAGELAMCPSCQLNFKKFYEDVIANDVSNNNLYVKKTEGTVADKDTVNIDYVGKKDGVAFERYAEKVRRRKADEKKANKEAADYNLAKFEKEITPMTDLYPVLRSFIRYAAQRTDKEALSQVVIKKIQELSERIKT